MVYIMASVAVATLGCSKEQGTEPHDMSAAQHEVSAGSERAAGAEHAEQYNPGAAGITTRCAGGRDFCWTSEADPTTQHRFDAERHRRLAEEHRAAAQSLRDAEARSCVGIADSDRDMSPFYHRDDIASVNEIERKVRRGEVKAGELSGGRTVFRAAPGMTAEWLQRLVDCHLARAAALGHEMPEMSYCPLVLEGANALVSSTDGGFAIDVTADDSKAAGEIWPRIEALVPRR